MSQADTDGLKQRLDLIARLIAAMITKDMSQKDSVLTVAAAGISQKEVAWVLGIGGNHVGAVISRERKAQGSKKSTGKA